MIASISSRDYYDLNPPIGNSPGDIWDSLPTFGLLPATHSAGLVITPACDLANHKAETVTYLPVISILSWFQTVGFFPEARRIIDGQWKTISDEPLLAWPLGYRLPHLSAISTAQSIVQERLAEARLPVKTKTALGRVSAGLLIIADLAAGSAGNPKDVSVHQLMGEGGLVAILEKLTTNSYRPDLHFLPSDGQRTDWAGIPTHSIVLFRYPITVPIDIFDSAQDITLQDWNAFLGTLEKQYSNAKAFLSARPMKRSRVKSPFISDLLARQVGLNMRLGSPDFTPQTVSTYVADILKKYQPR